MKLIERCCPACKSNNYLSLLEVPHESFISLNYTYNKDIISKCEIAQINNIPIVKCLNCGFIYTRYQLNDSLLEIVYNRIIDKSLSKNKIFRNDKRLRYLEIWYNIYKTLLSRNQNSSNHFSLLELGCGWGDFISQAKSCGVHCYGIEFDKRKIKYNKQLNNKVYNSLKKINKRSFDVFFSNQVLEHINDPLLILKEISEYLSDDFIGYISVPFYTDEKLNEIVVSAQQGIFYDKNINTWEHLNYFTPITLQKMLYQAGFEIFDIDTGQTVDSSLLNTTSVFIRKRGMI